MKGKLLTCLLTAPHANQSSLYLLVIILVPSRTTLPRYLISALDLTQIFNSNCGMPLKLLRVEYSIYNYRVWRTALPVRSAVFKPHTERGEFSKRP